MFKSLRWKLTLSFVWLSAIVCLLLGLLSLFIFTTTLNVALDQELRALSAEIARDITLTSPEVRLSLWEDIIQKKPSTFPATIQIFDISGDLLEQHGTKHKVHLQSIASNVGKGAVLGEETVAGKHLRIITSPLTNKDQTIGYLQVMLPTTYQEHATQHFAMTLLVVAPLLLLGLGIAGYIFAGKAVQPIEQNYALLRRFMADAGHELTTPISIIQANAESLEQELGENLSLSKTLFAKLQTIGHTTERMSNLVRDLTLLAKTEGASVLLRMETLQLNNLVSSVKQEFDQLFVDKNIKLVAGQIDHCQIVGNAESLGRATANLLQNALRYTDAGGTVTISLKNQGKQILLCVQDTGIGIKPEEVDQIFERFYRVEQSRSRAQGGSGLGLSIVKAVAQVHGGNVLVASEFGKGTTFSICLPAQS
jgi:signal transduction histidine kinase